MAFGGTGAGVTLHSCIEFLGSCPSELDRNWTELQHSIAVEPAMFRQNQLLIDLAITLGY
jgi:hypothetical protein